LAVGLATLLPGVLRGQQHGELNRLYGQGVNAYFAGRSNEAESYLSQALALDAEDPRIYYFRALSLLRLGRLDEARGDMMAGASVEAQHPQRFAVGRALERVQGGHRLMLERYRWEARSRQVALKPAQPGQRVGRPRPQITSHDEHVLRQRVVIPLDQLLASGTPQPLSAEQLSRRTRQALEARPIPPQPAPEAAVPAAASDDPFRDDATRPSTEEAAATAQPVAEPVRPPELEAEHVPDAEVTPPTDETLEAEEMSEAEAEDDPFGDL
jgi:tetratricopeptide (TPR) repeat protein